MFWLWWENTLRVSVSPRVCSKYCQVISPPRYIDYSISAKIKKLIKKFWKFREISGRWQQLHEAQWCWERSPGGSWEGRWGPTPILPGTGPGPRRPRAQEEDSLQGSVHERGRQAKHQQTISVRVKCYLPSLETSDLWYKISVLSSLRILLLLYLLKYHCIKYIESNISLELTYFTFDQS